MRDDDHPTPEAKDILEARGLVPTVVPADMAANIGRKIRFINWEPSMGTRRRDHTFTIVAVQKNYRDEFAYRVTCDGTNDTFGSVAFPGTFEFCDQPEQQQP